MHEPRSDADSGDGLPLDPDVDTYERAVGETEEGPAAHPTGSSRSAGSAGSAESRRSKGPVHRQWGLVGLVALGGALGTAAREGVSLAMPSGAAGSVATLAPVFLVNVTGAFALGLLLEVLLRRGPDHGLRRSLRLLVGTGFLGGFTTYSTLAVGAGQALDAGDPMLGLLYAAVSIIVGAAAAFAGVATAAAVHPPPRDGPGVDR